MPFITVDEEFLIDIEGVLSNIRNAALTAKHGGETDPVARKVGVDMVLEEAEKVLPRLQVMLFGGTITYDAARAPEQEAHNATER